MTAVATAIVGSAVVGAVTARNASKRQVKAAKQAEDEVLAFERERYQDWKDTYGDIEENLADYYGNLTPDYYEAMGLEAFQQEYESNMQQMRENLAQRGILDSGISASLELQGSLNAAESRAAIRRDSERQAMSDKSNFLQIGLGQNPANQLSNTMSTFAAQSRQRATDSEIAAGQATGLAINAVGTGISDYFRANPIGGGKE